MEFLAQKIMKRGSGAVSGIALAAAVVFSAPASAARTLLDDFSSGSVDIMKFSTGEGERRVDNGALLLSAAGHGLADGYARSRMYFNTAPWESAQVMVTVDSVDLGGGGNKRAFAEIAGTFYNTQATPNDSVGDVWVELAVGDRGRGLEAWYSIEESTNADFTTSVETLGEVIPPGTLSAGTPVRLKVSYDGDNGFAFEVDGATVNAQGPDRLSGPFGASRQLRSGIDSGVPEGAATGAGIASINAHYDDVLIGDQPYDDFSAAQIDHNKWGSGLSNDRMLRRVENGALRMEAHAQSSSSNRTRLILSDTRSQYLEAAMSLSSESNLPLGSSGRVRLSGVFYNAMFDGNYNGREGNVFAQLALRQRTDGSRAAFAYIERADDAAWQTHSQLFFQNFTTPLNLDQVYRAVIEVDGNLLRFKLDDEVIEYPIATSVFPPSPIDSHKHVQVRVDSGAGIAVGHVHDVYTDREASTAITVTPSVTQPQSGGDVVLTATFANPADIVDKYWEQTAGTSVVLSASTSRRNLVRADSVSFTAPDVTTAETLSFRITAVDRFGISQSRDLSITVNPKGTTNTGTNDSSGGGGSPAAPLLGLLGLLIARRRMIRN